MGKFIDLRSSDGVACPAYVAEPFTKARGGVVVLQEIFGVNSHIRSVADGYAKEGYLAIAPAMFHRVQPGVELGYTEGEMNEGVALKQAVEALPAPGAMSDIQAAIAHVSRAGKVAIVGYCWGGLLAWRAACTLHGLAAASSYYGAGVAAPKEIARNPKCPVIAHFGEQDEWITPDSVEKLRKAHPEVGVHIYDADHGFNCDQRGSYDAEAAKLARQRTLAFFAEHVDL